MAKHFGIILLLMCVVIAPYCTYSAAIGNEHPELIENDKEQPHEIDDIEDGSDEWNNIDKLQRMLLEEEATTAAAITLPKGAMLIALLLSFTIRF